MPSILDDIKDPGFQKKALIVGGGGLGLATVVLLLKGRGNNAPGNTQAAISDPAAAVVGSTSAGSVSPSVVDSLWGSMQNIQKEIDNIQLVPGPAGAVGPAGPVGPSGVPGTAGMVGPVGATGPGGAPGPVGVAGPVGSTGPAGVSPPPATAAPIQTHTDPGSVTPPAFNPPPVNISPKVEKVWKPFSTNLIYGKTSNLVLGQIALPGGPTPVPSVSVVNTGPTSDPNQFNAKVYVPGDNTPYDGYIDPHGNVNAKLPSGWAVIGGDAGLVNQPAGYGHNY